MTRFPKLHALLTGDDNDLPPPLTPGEKLGLIVVLAVIGWAFVFGLARLIYLLFTGN